MVGQFIDVALNPHFEAYISGPLLGVILGALFGGWNSKRSRAESSPIEAKRQMIQHKETVHHHYHHHERSSIQRVDDGPTVMVVGMVVMAILMFLFTAFLQQIATFFCIFTASVAAFAFTASIAAFLTGEFNSPEWWGHTIFPILISIICFYLMLVIQNSIDPQAVSIAQSLLANKPLSFGLIFNSVFAFFKTLNTQYTTWIMFEMGALIFVAFAALGALGQCTYYISLSKTRGNPTTVWINLTSVLSRFSGRGTIAAILIFTSLGWFFASGRLYWLWH